MASEFKKYYVGITVIIVSMLMLLCLFSCKKKVTGDIEYQTDSANIDRWIEASRHLLFNDHDDDKELDSGRILLQKAINISRKIQYHKGTILGYIDLGHLSALIKKPSEGRQYFEKALSVASQQHLDSFFARIYLNIATTYNMEENYEQCAFYNILAIQLQEKFISDAEKAGIPVSTRSLQPLIGCYYSLGRVFIEMTQYDRALYYFQKCIQLTRDSGEDLPLTAGLIGISSVYEYIDSLKQAEASALEALKVSLKGNWPIQEMHSLRRLGEIYLKNNPGNALPYLQQALTIAQKIPSVKMILLNDIGQYYLGKHQYTLAEKKFIESYELAIQENQKAYIKKTHYCLSQVYAGQNKFKDAFYEQQRYDTLSDSLSAADTRNKVNLLEIKFRTAEKDKSIAESKLLIAQQNDKIFKKNILIWGISGSSGILVIFFLLLYRNKQRIQMEKLRILKKEEKVNMLLSAMNGEEKERSRLANELHDGIGGLLSTVKMYFSNVQSKAPSLITLPEYKEGMALLDETLIELRKTAHNLMPNLLLKNQLPEALRQLSNTIQNANQIKISFQYYGFVGRLNNNFELFIYRIIQELLQNVVKHAQATDALVQISLHNQVLSITVEDNGIGINDNAPLTDGMGLKTIKSRIEEIDGYFMVSSGKPNGTSVYIEIDLENNKKFDNFTSAVLPGMREVPENKS